MSTAPQPSHDSTNCVDCNATLAAIQLAAIAQFIANAKRHQLTDAQRRAVMAAFVVDLTLSSTGTTLQGGIPAESRTAFDALVSAIQDRYASVELMTATLSKQNAPATDTPQ